MRQRNKLQKKPNQYLQDLFAYWKARRKGDSLASRSGIVNECWKPSNEASLSDLHEYHREKMGIKKAKRRIG